MADGEERWIDRGEALARLGVKTQTLYAYVSRGRIDARPDPTDPRRSLYAAADIARMKDGSLPGPRTTPRVSAARGEAEVRTSVSTWNEGKLIYRGHDVVELAAKANLEATARLLWDADHDAIAPLRPRVGATPGGSVRARLFAALARKADEAPPLSGRSPREALGDAAEALNEAVDAAAGPGPKLFFHQRLGRMSRASERGADLIRRMLVLGADDGVDAAALATRAAASGGAPLAGAALAGLVVLPGQPMARELAAAQAWVVEARRDPVGTTRRQLDRAGEAALPGFGVEADARAEALLTAAVLPADLMGVVLQARTQAGLEPGFAIALALVARHLDLPRDGAIELWMTARVAGLTAHALDQAVEGSPIRARMRYVRSGVDAGA